MERTIQRTRILVALLSAIFIGGCATTPLKLEAEYVAAKTPAETGREILGEYKVSADDGFFHNYESEWRNGYCGAQRPLVFATLFLFEVFPTYWACYKDSHYPIAKLDAAAEKLAAKKGGRAVVVSYEDREGDTAKSVSGYIVRASR